MIPDKFKSLCVMQEMIQTSLTKSKKLLQKTFY